MSHSQTAVRVGREPFPASIFWLSSFVSHQTSDAAASLWSQAAVTEKPWLPDHPLCLPEEPAGCTMMPTLPARLGRLRIIEKRCPAGPVEVKGDRSGRKALAEIVPKIVGGAGGTAFALYRSTNQFSARTPAS